jgi:hypothetical protein
VNAALRSMVLRMKSSDSVARSARATGDLSGEAGTVGRL